ncbi:MAG: diadenylate cyclase CdaA [Paludibacteraceae bacterium]|nr:diadenylate cyclase CdaA [Paludibacteraceae bacterium]
MGFEIYTKDIIDIILVAFLFYTFYRLLRRSGAINIFWGILAFVIVWFIVSYAFALELTGAIFDRIISVGAIALIVLFQEEIRNFLIRLGSQFSILNIHRNIHNKRQQTLNENNATQIALACKNMAKTKTGALIVLTQQNPLVEYTSTGENVNADISARLIENIFFKNTPLHDGAVIISNGKIKSAACILPVSKNTTIPQHYGLRHRAALGIAEKTDAIAIVVSEERGDISVAEKNTIKTVKIEELQQILTEKL